MISMYAILNSFRLLGQETQGSLSLMAQHMLAAVVFSLMGVVFFFGSLWLMEKLTPFSISKEITEEHNLAVSIVIGAIVVGMAIVIAAAIMG